MGAISVMATNIRAALRIGVLALAASATGLVLSGCSEEPDIGQIDTVPGRWYTAEQVARGKPVFESHCTACHGTGAVGDPNWRKRDAEGYFPPPPLNGTAHAWHHPLDWLRGTIVNGGQARMPAWGDQLSPEDIDATIAWFQSLWPEEIYGVWAEGNARYESNQGG